MRKLLITIFLLVGLVASLAAMDPAELNRVTFKNDTGFTILFLFFSPGDSEWWGPDILGSTMEFEDGDEMSFYIHYPEYSNEFDFMAVDEDMDAYYKWNVEINDGEELYVEISLADYEGDSAEDMNFSEIIFTNVSDEDIWYMFLSPSDSEMWGIDVLDDETIFSVGDTYELLVPTGSEGTSYDLFAVDEDGGTFYRSIEVSSRKDEWYIDITEADRN